MQLEHQFSVPVPVADAWEVLLDVERVAPCMPGATVESFDGETIVGKVKVKVGPIQVTYAGEARFKEKDEAARRVVVDAAAKEARGAGTANATITAALHDAGGTSTNVTVTTDLAITGKPAQFGRGVMVEVGNKLLGRFADCLSDELGSAPAAVGAPSADGSAAAAPSGADRRTTLSQATPTPGPRPSAKPAAGQAADRGGPQGDPTLRSLRERDHDAIDLLDVAGAPLLKRLAPVIGGALLLLLVWRLVARRR
jgi:uncharacterized protein